nr:M48 family metallopeptidase [Actinomycetota bacterium]
WALRALLAGAVAGALLVAVTLPLAYVRGYAIEHAWGLSTQGVGDWALDRVKGLGIATITSAVAALVFFGVVRWQPRAWWIWGWASFTVLSALVAFLWPVVVAPLFNRFTPLADEALVARVRSLAGEAGVTVDDVLVADASRRTTAENAYVAGLGDTKRMVLYDTLLRERDDDQVTFVIAHELAHEAEGHVAKGVALSSAGFLVAFGLLAWLGGRADLWEWAGASGIGDLRALPALALFASALTLLALPLESAISRRFEARADEVAIGLTGDADAAVSAFRRLALKNLADLDPPPAAVALFYSHPPIPDRIRAVLATERDAP